MTAGDTPTERAGRTTRRVAVVWTLVVVAASVVDPAVVLGAAEGSAAPAGVDAFVIAHLVAYGTLAWLLAGAAESQGVRVIVATIAVAAAVGVGIELLQAPVAARTASASDALVNAVGAAAGASLHAAFENR